jgi:UDP-N-acetylmuramate--alanine ligase
VAVNSGASSYHLVGIGGIGMSAIARLLLARGAQVSGSDMRRTALVEALEAEGATVAIGHRAENVGTPDLVIVSSAIAHENPEFVAALERGIDIKTRGAMLAELTGSRKTIAIAGTHGKTTTTAMTATVLEAAGVAPTYAIGGLRVDTGTNAGTGSGAWFVTESDESDGSFLHLQPTIAVVNNVENDHLSSDDELPRLLEQFATFVQRVPPDGCAIIGIDNRGSAFIAKTASVPKTTFATRADADLMARDIVYEGLGSRFTVIERGHDLGTVRLNVPGEINIQNALASIAVARMLKVDMPAIAAALASTTTRIIRPRSRKRSRPRAASPRSASWLRFRRTSIRARAIWRRSSPPRSRWRMPCCLRRSMRRTKRRSPA